MLHKQEKKVYEAGENQDLIAEPVHVRKCLEKHKDHIALALRRSLFCTYT